MALTRRTLLAGMARLGGAGAAYETLTAWDFLQAPPIAPTLPAISAGGRNPGAQVRAPRTTSLLPGVGTMPASARGS
jgi:hypothetical protein